MKVSLVTPTLMRSRFHPLLQQFIEQQTYRNFEHIVIEEWWSYEQTYHIPNATYVVIDDIPKGQRVSLGHKYNKAHEILTGDIVLRINTDWYISPTYIEDYTHWFKDPDVQIILKKNTRLYNIKDKTTCLLKNTDQALIGAFGYRSSLAKQIQAIDNPAADEDIIYAQRLLQHAGHSALFVADKYNVIDLRHISDKDVPNKRNTTIAECWCNEQTILNGENASWTIMKSFADSFQPDSDLRILRTLVNHEPSYTALCRLISQYEND